MLLIVTVLVFVIVRVLPGDPILIYVSQSELNTSSPEQVEFLRHEYGLDKAPLVQYFEWIANAAHGDLGVSIFQNQTVTALIKTRMPVTVYLGALAFLLSTFTGITMGIISAVRRGSKIDTIATLMANFGITVPSFWLGILMIYFFGLYLNWLPIYGFTSPLTDFKMSIGQSIMPVIALAVFPLASVARQTRSSMLEIIHQDYIRTAWAKGLRERVIIIRHALKNGLIPVVTLIGTQIRNIVGGAVLIETVFNIPGMGRLAVTGIFNHDYAVVQGVILLVGLVIIATNLVVDLSYSWIDPRVRYA